MSRKLELYTPSLRHPILIHFPLPQLLSFSGVTHPLKPAMGQRVQLPIAKRFQCILFLGWYNKSLMSSDSSVEEVYGWRHTSLNSDNKIAWLHQCAVCKQITSHNVDHNIGMLDTLPEFLGCHPQWLHHALQGFYKYTVVKWCQCICCLSLSSSSKCGLSEADKR